VKKSIDVILHKTFRPEFLNRIDSIILFRKLEQEDIKKIARIHIATLTDRLAAQQITLEIDDKVLDLITDKGFVKEFGARPLKRALQQYVIVPLSEYILKHPDQKSIRVTVKKGAVVIEAGK
jgi:ATP-dependent Clp protease ATP-binding subunit ClpA